MTMRHFAKKYILLFWKKMKTFLLLRLFLDFLDLDFSGLEPFLFFSSLLFSFLFSFPFLSLLSAVLSKLSVVFFPSLLLPFVYFGVELEGRADGLGALHRDCMFTRWCWFGMLVVNKKKKKNRCRERAVSICGKLKREALQFSEGTRSVPTCFLRPPEATEMLQDARQAAPLFQGNYPGQIKNQLSLSRCPGSFS